MRGSGNDDEAVCVANILNCKRGEVPYERMKGIDPLIFDKTLDDGELEFIEDAQWNVETYEQRVDFDNVQIEEGEQAGDVLFLVHINEVEEEEE